MPLLIASHLAKSFGGVQAVADVSFEVGAGELVALIGPNGAGKSTCFNLINGQLKPDRGTVSLDGYDITGHAPREIWRLGVGRTFQVTATYGSMTVRENLQMVLLSQARHLFRAWRPASSLFAEQANAALEHVGIVHLAERQCSVLAYGDLKRVELAVAVAAQPRLLLMDEPTAGMAPAERERLMELTARLSQRQGIGVLFTEHSMDVVFAYAHRVLVMARGRIMAAGTPAEVRANPEVQAVYLGTDAG